MCGRGSPCGWRICSRAPLVNSEHVAVRYVDAPLVDDAWVDVNVALSFSLVVVEWLFSTFIDVAFVDVAIVDLYICRTSLCR